MAIILKGGGQDFERELTPAGTYHAVIFNVFDLGIVDEEYKGQKKSRHKISVGFELVGQTYKSGPYAGKPVTKYKDYSATLYGEQGLMALIPVLIGRQLSPQEVEAGLDAESLIGKNCILTITHKISQTTGNPYAKIASIGGLVDGMNQVSPSIPRDLIPDFIREKMGKTTTHESKTSDFYEEVRKSPEEMQAEIKDWINKGFIKKEDANASAKIIGKKFGMNPWTYEAYEELYAKMSNLKEQNKKAMGPDITEGTDFVADPVQPPAF